jgi:hypothetical protein
MDIEIKIGIGEAIDRVTILIIKEEKIGDEDKLKNITLELDLLTNKLLPVPELPEMKDLFGKLLSINGELWDVEDALRVMEAQKDFGVKFIELARSVYRLNDERAAIKKKINELYNSEIVEEKSYK